MEMHSFSHSNRSAVGDDRQRLIYEQNASTRSFIGGAVSPRLYCRPLGKPTTKSIHIMDILAMALSVICLAVGIMSVASEAVSWRLGQGTNQLIVLGFLLSVMNLCLASIAPTFFLLLEARFGRSALQNYNGILRNQPLASRLGFSWRLVLVFMLALPVGLSVAYKRFTGGQSARAVDAATYVANSSHYGMFAPPGLQILGAQSGVSLFFNATLPFAASATSSPGRSASDFSPSFEVGAYGYNMVLLDNGTTAFLDMPYPDYLSNIQQLLAEGESWRMVAPVLATVSAYNRSKEEDATAWNTTFMSYCIAAQASSGAYTHQSTMNDWAVELVNHPSPGPQDQQYIGITPDFGINWLSPCYNFSYYAQQYSVNRQRCEATWSITRAATKLVGATCDGTILDANQQQIITNNTLFPGVFYMSSLMELLGPVDLSAAGGGDLASPLIRPYFATGVAAMLWSRITVLNTETNPGNLRAGSGWVDPPTGQTLTWEDVGLIYPTDDQIIYIRPTLQKSGWLYTILAVQPLLMVIMLISSSFLHSTPVGRGFGLVSILAGIDRGSLDRLYGATLSGSLTEDVGLVIQPEQELHSREGCIKYYLESSNARTRNGRLFSHVKYD